MSIRLEDSKVDKNAYINDSLRRRPILQTANLGVLLNFPVSRGTPQIWRYGVRPQGLIVRAYDLYRRRPRFVEVLERKHLSGKQFEIVALDAIRYAYKGAGALGAHYYEDVATFTAKAKEALGDRTLLVAGLSPASMIVASHAGAGLLSSLCWVSAANYGRLLLSTAEQFVPADLDKAAIKQRLARCACPICKMDSRRTKSLIEYLDLKPSIGTTHRVVRHNPDSPERPEERHTLLDESFWPRSSAKPFHNRHSHPNIQKEV